VRCSRQLMEQYSENRNDWLSARGFAGTDVPTFIKNDFNSSLKPPTTVIATVAARRREIFVHKGSKKSVTTYCSSTSLAKSVPTVRNDYVGRSCDPQTCKAEKIIRDLGAGTAGVPPARVERNQVGFIIDLNCELHLIKVARDAGRRGRLRSQHRGHSLQSCPFEPEK